MYYDKLKRYVCFSLFKISSFFFFYFFPSFYLHLKFTITPILLINHNSMNCFKTHSLHADCTYVHLCLSVTFCLFFLQHLITTSNAVLVFLQSPPGHKKQSNKTQTQQEETKKEFPGTGVPLRHKKSKENSVTLTPRVSACFPEW